MKLIVIGGNPAGLSAASAARRLHPDWIIDVYEMGGYISYASCGLPYYLSYGFTSDKLITLTKEVLLERRNIPVHIFHKVFTELLGVGIELPHHFTHNHLTLGSRDRDNSHLLDGLT